MIAFLRWWLLVCLMIIGTVTIKQFGLFSALYEADISKLSFLIIFIFTITSAYIGHITYRLYKGMSISESEVTVCWFFADECQTIGLIGTVIGFLVMLGLAFVNLNVEDTASIQASIVLMTLGMSSALTTTLVGMAASILLKLQLININDSQQIKK